jgi:hypothetical protein
MVAVLFVLLALYWTGGGDAAHEDLNARLTVIEFEVRFQSCVIALPPVDRTPGAIAECQAGALVD